MDAHRSTSVARGADEVESRLRANYGDYRVHDAAAAMQDDIVATSNLLLNRASFIGAVDLTVSAGPYVSVGGATGICRWRTAREEGDATRSAYLLAPGVETHVHFDDSVGTGISFPVDALERTLQRMHADDSLRVTFTGSSPRDAAEGRALREMTQFVVAERESALNSELIAATLYRHAAARVLEGFPQRREPPSRSSSPRSLLTGYRRAIRFVDDHAHLPITVDDIAEAAGLPTAELDAAVRWHADRAASARDLLRRARLSGAHRDLLAVSEEEDGAVERIGLRWGFSPALLLRLHRMVYGVDPAAVLRGEHRFSSAPEVDGG